MQNRCRIQTVISSTGTQHRPCNFKRKNSTISHWVIPFIAALASSDPDLGQNYLCIKLNYVSNMCEKGKPNCSVPVNHSQQTNRSLVTKVTTYLSAPQVLRPHSYVWWWYRMLTSSTPLLPTIHPVFVFFRGKEWGFIGQNSSSTIYTSHRNCINHL